MSADNSWFGILAGVFAVIFGLYSLLRTGSVANLWANRGVPHSLQQIKILGVLFILAGLFIIAVAIKNY